MSGSQSSSSRVYTHAHRHSYVSQRGTIEILKSIRENGLPDAVSRGALKRARLDHLDLSTPYGPLFDTIEVELLDGKKARYPAVVPVAFLHGVLKRCSGFRSYFESALRATPATLQEPWRISLYVDEVLPGNALKVTNERKLVAFYWSFLEHGRRVHSEALWFHVLSVRSSSVKRIKAGVSQIMSKILELFFRPGVDLRYGIQFEIPGNAPSMFFARLGMIIADEAALKAVFSFKGASGTMMCFRCSNVVAHNIAILISMTHLALWRPLAW